MSNVYKNNKSSELSSTSILHHNGYKNEWANSYKIIIMRKRLPTKMIALNEIQTKFPICATRNNSHWGELNQANNWIFNDRRIPSQKTLSQNANTNCFVAQFVSEPFYMHIWNFPCTSALWNNHPFLRRTRRKPMPNIFILLIS